MGYIPPPERPLMEGESREHWYLERRAELLRAKSYNESMLGKWVIVESVIIILIFILILLYIFL